jgi:hypothetical protein
MRLCQSWTDFLMTKRRSSSVQLEENEVSKTAFFFQNFKGIPRASTRILSISTAAAASNAKYRVLKEEHFYTPCINIT